MTDRSLASSVLEWSTDTNNQASGRAYGGAGAGDSLIIGQLGFGQQAAA